MIHSGKLTFIGDRAAPLDYLAKLSQERKITVIDVGASANPWSMKYLTHVVDFQNYGTVKAHYFTGNICREKVWNEVREYVKSNGKFDFLVCTHTLEDISSPAYVCDMFGQIAKEGFVAVPSKYSEFSKPESVWLGHIHHRWIYDLKDNQFMGYPKQPFLEHMDFVKQWQSRNQPSGNTEVQFFWKDECELKLVNDDFLGPTADAVIGYYRGLLA